MSRKLPTGTAIVLKKPLTGDVGWRDLGSQSFSLGRIVEGYSDNSYDVTFEGLVNDDGIPVQVNFKRDKFVLARTGT